MKKLVLMVMAGVMGAALLAGCGSSKKDETAAEATTESVPEQITVDYSTGLNEDGTLANVNAADYVTVCQYTNLEIPRDQVEVTKDEVQEQIDSLLSSHTTENEITDRKIKDGDLVNIDYEGTIDGTAFDGGTAQGQRLTIGSGTFIDNFEEQLVGKKPGEEVDVTVTFPEDYAQADLAGKEAVFKVKINSIIETVTPELTDEFVKENYEASQGVATVKELKKKIKTQLQDSKYTNYLWNYLLENSTFKTKLETIDSSFSSKVSTWHAKQADVDEYEISSSRTMASILELLEKGDLLLLPVDSSGKAFGSLKFVKNSDDSYTITMSKDTNVSLRTAKEIADGKSGTSSDGKSEGKSDSGDSGESSGSGKSNSVAKSQKTADSVVLPLYGAMGSISTLLFGAFAVLRKKFRG